MSGKLSGVICAMGSWNASNLELQAQCFVGRQAIWVDKHETVLGGKWFYVAGPGRQATNSGDRHKRKNAEEIQQRSPTEDEFV